MAQERKFWQRKSAGMAVWGVLIPAWALAVVVALVGLLGLVAVGLDGTERAAMPAIGTISLTGLASAALLNWSWDAALPWVPSWQRVVMVAAAIIAVAGVVWLAYPAMPTVVAAFNTVPLPPQTLSLTVHEVVVATVAVTAAAWRWHEPVWNAVTGIWYDVVG